MSKTCSKCGATKPLTDFYKHPKTLDRRQARCKECAKADVRENRIRNAEYYRQYDAMRYQNDPKVKERHRRYQSTEAGKMAAKKSRRKWAANNQDKRAAHVILGNAVQSGKIIKPDNCSSCGKDGCRIHGHHEDYTKPLDVIWLCAGCHVKAHKEG